LRRGGTWVQRWRVPLGFLAAPLFLLLAEPSAPTLAAGGAVALVGLLVRAWASGHIRKNDALATSGPYAHTRNPLYLGSFVMGLGFTVAASGRWWQFAVLGALFAALFLGIYVPVMRVEAQHLAAKFGGEFEAYARAVPLFLPRATAFRGARATEFDARLYLRYREYRAALGLGAAFALLVLKWLLLE
jgi:protein-S-isoprenylcysteine O-methyltransferase Ste14